MHREVLFVGTILLFCGMLAKADEVHSDNDNYYLNADSLKSFNDIYAQQEEPIGGRREGDYYDAYPGQTYSTDTQVTSTVDRQSGLEGEAALVSVIPGIAALLGVIVLAWVQANDQNNQQKQIDKVCTTAKALGGFTCTKSATPTVAELGACFDTLVAFSTPDC